MYCDLDFLFCIYCFVLLALKIIRFNGVVVNLGDLENLRFFAVYG
ncbi:hypothetical protein OF001_U30210 [Pseudomonas sp. OF001]|nr:hypothetical protein OF001_U30210 [Pseudomonas sp. OF001]